MNPLIRKGGSHHRMSQFSRPQPRSNPGCTSAALPPTIKFHGFTSVHPPPKLPAEFISSPLKACTSSPKAEMSLSLLPAAGGAAPGPERPGARVDTHKGAPSPAGAANPSKQRGGNRAQTGGGGGGLGVPTTGPSAAPHHRLASSAVPFPRPRSRRRGEPAALPPPAARAAAPPPRRAGGPWLPRGPSEEALLHGELRAGPHPGTSRRTPGIRAYFGRRMRAKPAELEDVPGRPRRAPPIHLTGARSRAPSPQSLWSALRDAATAGLGEKTAWCLLSWRKPSCLTSIVLGRFLEDTGFGSWG